MTAVIRQPKPSDQSYIAATWARSVLSTHVYQRHLGSRTGRDVGKQIDEVLDRPDTRALVCVRDQDRDYIVGWVLYCVGPAVPTVHYTYVRKDERQRGIAGALLRHIGVQQDAAVVCTSDGPSGAQLRRRYPCAVHVPLAEFLK